MKRKQGIIEFLTGNRSKRKIPYWIVPVKKLIHNKKVPEWCRLPYQRHPKGCPNYGKKNVCPPQAPYITDVIDIKKPMYLVFSEFNLEAHMDKMKARHPTWSEAGLRNVLYWQKTSRKQLKERTGIAKGLLKTNVVIYLPEAAGVHVYATAFHSGLKLEKIRGLKFNRHISLIGFRQNML